MKGILFKPDMVKAIMDGKKTQTRRLSGLKEINKFPDDIRNQPNNGHPHKNDDGSWTFRRDNSGLADWFMVRPRYLPGETVYVKEGLELRTTGTPIRYSLDALAPIVDGETLDPCDWKWKGNKLSPMFLPECFARTFLKILSVEPQRLREISPEDCEAEGIKWTCGYYCDERVGHVDHQHMINEYFALWDSINPDYPSSLNPWVWKYTLQLTERKP